METGNVGERYIQSSRQTSPEMTDGCRTGNDFFEVSKIVESPGMLQGWVEWFMQRGIPCLIVKRSKGYSLWRKGEEIGIRKSTRASGLQKENIVSSFGL